MVSGVPGFMTSATRKLRKVVSTNPEATAEIVIRKLYARYRGRRNPLGVATNGRSVRIHHRSTDADIFAVWQCFYKSQYELPRPRWHPPAHRDAVQRGYEAIVAAGRTPLIVDCGAYIGVSSLWFAARYPDAYIVAVEPAPDNARLARENAQGHHIEVIEAGIGAEEATLALVDSGNGTMGYRTVDAGDALCQVAMVTLRSILSQKSESIYQPFILKIDIEGSEKALFAKTPWTDFDRFPVIIVEEHDFMMPGRSTGSAFFEYHARRERDFLFVHENIFSIDCRALAGS
jgi:FkbM family methyltransferase